MKSIVRFNGKFILILIVQIFCFELLSQNQEHAMENYQYDLIKIAEGAYSNPVSSPDGKYITFTGSKQDGINIMDTEGKDLTTLTTHTGAGYKYAYSLDSEMIVYRGTFFQDTKRLQFIGLINLKEKTDTILVIYKRLQPPAWRYTNEGKRIVYVVNDEVIETEIYPFVQNFSYNIFNNSHINTYFYYKEGGFYIVESASKNINENVKIEGMDPVFSPDRTKFVYCKGDNLYLYLFDNKEEIKLDKGIHASWSPDGSSIVYQKTTDDGHIITSSDLYIMALETKQIKRLTETEDILESNPFWTKDGKSILFDDEKNGGIYKISFKE